MRRLPSPKLFPTRRSSDLAAGGRRVRPAPALADGAAPGRLAAADEGRRPGRGDGSRDLRPARRTAPDRGQGRTRSEEHTSELQSRRDLVCRLLLEKKKLSI